MPRAPRIFSNLKFWSNRNRELILMFQLTFKTLAQMTKSMTQLARAISLKHRLTAQN